MPLPAEGVVFLCRVLYVPWGQGCCWRITFPSCLAHRSHTALSTAAVARCTTPFSGPIWLGSKTHQHFLEKKRKGYLGLLARDTLQELKGSNGSSALTLEKIEGRRRRGRQRMRWMASPTQWTGVSVNSGSWWWTGRRGVLQSMRSQRVRHD